MTSTETLWQEISAAALLGTQRRPFEPAHASGLLGTVLAAPPAAAGEQMLLRAAALTALHRRAGQLPALSAPLFPPACPAEEWLRCSPRADGFLEQILSSDKSLPLLAEWIEIAASRRVRVREEHLAALFQHHKALQNLPRHQLLPVLGARGRWLAAQNPDWLLFAAVDGERMWQEGSRQQRQVLLADLRAQDPARARALLESTWEQESHIERATFLQVLAQGLSMGDEPFLEALLDDRRKEVRQLAAFLLAHLPAGRLVARMTERARSLLNWRSGLLRSSLEVRLPGECTAEMQRDGVDPRPPAGSNLGEKAGWLSQILAVIPPRIWSAAWNRRPAQILDAIQKHEWEEALLDGWSKAAVLHRDEEWLEAVMNLRAKRGHMPQLFQLFSELPARAKEKIIVALMRENPDLSYDQSPSAFLSACRFPWSADMSFAVTTAICWTLQKGDMQPWRWEKLLRDIAPYFHAASLDTTSERIAAAIKKRPGGDPSAAGLLAVLELRLSMRQAFDTQASGPAGGGR